MDEASAVQAHGKPVMAMWNVFGVWDLAFLLPATLFAIYNIFLCPLYLSPLSGLPGPKDNLFFFGQCYRLLQSQWVPYLFHEWSRQWPSSPFIRYLGIANSECLVANSVTAYRDILHTQSDSFVKPSLTRRCARVVIGDGLPFAEGYLHRRRRAALTGTFNTAHVKSMVPIMREKARQLVNVLEQKRSFLNEVEVESCIWKTTLDIIGIDTLGVDLDHLGPNTTSPLHSLFERTMRQSTVGHVIHYLSSYLPLRNLIPIRTNGEFLQNCANARNYLRDHLNARRLQNENVAQGRSKFNSDALQKMIDEPDLWREDDIVEYLLNLVVLGHDTTACTLVWAVHMLSRHPTHQARLRCEISELLRTTQCPTYDDLDRLSFLENFLREVLRLYCPVAYVPREATRDVVVDGITLPKGTVVNLCPAVLNLHPLVWGETAGEFNPDRWESMSDVVGGAYAFQSFHHGPRICLGKQFSMTEMKVILVELLSRFDIRAVDASKQVLFARPSFTLRPEEALCVQLLDITDANELPMPLME